MTWREEMLERYREAIEKRRAETAEYDGDRRPRTYPNTVEEEAEDEFARIKEAWEKQIPPRMSKWTPDDLDGPAREAFDEWRESGEKRNVIIMGPVGTGKSVAGHAFLRHVQACGVWRSGSISTAHLMDRLRPSGDETSPLERWSRLDVLMLDDLGTEKPSEWVEERLFLLVDERWQFERPTIATTNLTPKRLREVLGDRVYSRIQDNAIAVTLAGSDRRREAA
jgi:chromosomal replication initiation ATPase DnaA